MKLETRKTVNISCLSQTYDFACRDCECTSLYNTEKHMLGTCSELFGSRNNVEIIFEATVLLDFKLSPFFFIKYTRQGIKSSCHHALPIEMHGFTCFYCFLQPDALLSALKKPRTDNDIFILDTCYI